MKAVVTQTEQLHENGHRLDGSYHTSDGILALSSIQRWVQEFSRRAEEDAVREGSTRYRATRVDRIVDLCGPEGVFIGGRAKRIYVDDRNHGIPFLSSSDMLKASFETAKLISKKRPDLEPMILRKGWTLISRSGTIGNTAYVRADMEGLAGSEHIMRVVPDPDKIPPGYLYAFLSGKMGVAICKTGTFGTVVDTISPEFVGSIPVPRLQPDTEQHIHELIERAASLRVEANEELASIGNDVSLGLGLTTDFPTHYDHARAMGSASVHSRNLRLDAYYYVGYAGEAAAAIGRVRAPKHSLSEVAAEIFEPPVFRRIYVGSNGVPYLMGYEVYESHPKPSRHLARNTRDMDRYVLHEGMIAIQSAGQRYGLLGIPIYVNRTLAGKAATNNMVRIVSPDRSTAGYLFAFLSTEIGRRLIVRESYGSSLPHIFPAWVGAIPIPWPEEGFRTRIGERVVIAFDKRARANELEDEARHALSKALGIEKI